MTDDLRQVLIQRQLSTPQTPSAVPAWSSPSTPQAPVTPPTTATQLPPKWQRFDTAQKMQDAVRNGWAPNPTLVRVLQGNK